MENCQLFFMPQFRLRHRDAGEEQESQTQQIDNQTKAVPPASGDYPHGTGVGGPGKHPRTQSLAGAGRVPELLVEW